MAIGKKITAKVRFRVQQQELKQANATLDGMRARLLGANNAATGLTGRLYRMATAFAAFSVGTRAVGGLLSSITTGERMMAQLNVLEGGLDKAGAKWKEMLRFARETPFQIEENMTAYIALKGRGLDPSYEAMTAYGNVSAALGVRINDMTDAIAGSVVGLQQRLRNLGVGVKTNANTIEFTVQGVTTTVARNSQAIQAFWKNAGNTVFAKAMELQMNTLGGRLSNLKDVLFGAALAVGEGTTGNGLSSSLQGVIAWLDAAGQSGYGAARAFGDKLAVAVRKLGELLKWLAINSEKTERAVRLLFAAVAARSVVSGILSAAAAMRAFSAASLSAQASVLLIPAAVVALALVLEDFYVFMKGGNSLIGDMLGDDKKGMLDGLVEPLRKLAEVAERLAISLGEALLKGLVALGPTLVNSLTAALGILTSILDIVDSLLSLVPSGSVSQETKEGIIRAKGIRDKKTPEQIEAEIAASRPSVGALTPSGGTSISGRRRAETARERFNRTGEGLLAARLEDVVTGWKSLADLSKSRGSDIMNGLFGNLDDNTPSPREFSRDQARRDIQSDRVRRGYPPIADRDLLDYQVDKAERDRLTKMTRYRLRTVFSAITDEIAAPWRPKSPDNPLWTSFGNKDPQLTANKYDLRIQNVNISAKGMTVEDLQGAIQEGLSTAVLAAMDNISTLVKEDSIIR